MPRGRSRFASPAAPRSHGHDDDLLDQTESEAIQLRRVLEGLVGSPATEGNAADVLRNGDEIVPATLDAIAEPRRTIDVLTFVYWTGEIAQQFADALPARAAAVSGCASCSTRRAPRRWTPPSSSG